MPHTTTRVQTRMPPDKQNAKPFTPSLSSNFRGTKSPLTPRLAGTGPGSGQSTPASGPRREAFVRSRSPGKEEQQQPQQPNLGGNITPRSAARKSRFGTESPSTTPTANRTNVASPPVHSPGGQNGLGISGAHVRGATSLNEVVASNVSPSPLYTATRRVSNTQSTVTTQDPEASKFFHASDARPTQAQPQPKPDQGRFFYVGGTSSISSPKADPPAGDDKFFHASDARSQSQPKPTRPELHTRSTAGSAASLRSIQATTTPRNNVRSTSPGKTVQSRPRSWGKDAAPRPLSGIMSTATASTPNRRGSVGSNLSASKDVQTAHKKTMSATSVTSTPTRKMSGPRPLLIPTLEQRLGEALSNSTASTISLPIPTASPETLSARSLSLGSQISDRSLSNARPSAVQQSPEVGTVPSVPSSPRKRVSLSHSVETSALPPNSPPLPATVKPADPAVQARRERKVLDLEISNSSLLAINKTLERELRKQNGELRRFRRLSRSGRLSVAPNNARNVSNSTLGTLPELQDEVEDDSEDEDEHSDSDASSSGDNDDLDSLRSNHSTGDLSSPTIETTKRARQRRRDEKRLLLDLHKHQQALLASQKLSQSIRRCLLSTEELIRDGEKALEYKPDLLIGGRVLSHDGALLRPGTADSAGEDTGTATPAMVAEEGAKGLLSPGVEIGDWLAGGMWVSQGAGKVETMVDDG
ncbi:uncharacterized protein AB675_3485 [Cyphellophora attinorum]|uniref:Uncharacterized protein n=1 Tax=Cyphellophora attinorum TaxID=1664694 RepID=A0A0N1HAH9_9EURO|nr:uncharacterized protein AB675_3485 [Phialophora attinorum]KPI39662.1 hypothetical protein AB675_3485 [Phialophora attinorum]